MPRFAMIIEYDGSPYSGWQRQKDAPSVQQTIEEVLFAITQEETFLQCAGRTDAGVHATGQVAHTDISKNITANRLREALNAHLRQLMQPISIQKVWQTDDNFNARHDAIKRIYCYKILAQRPPPALDLHRVWHVPTKLDATAMHDAAQVLLGQHDFSTFRTSECQAKSPIKTLDRFDVVKCGAQIHLHVEAQSFLHSQVRSFAGSLKHVGEGRWSKEDLRDALNARDRKRCGQVAPPYGLYLEQVIYPK